MNTTPSPSPDPSSKPPSISLDLAAPKQDQTLPGPLLVYAEPLDIDAIQAALPAFEAEAKRMGFAQLCVSVESTDAKTVRAFESIGFRATGRAPYKPLGGGQVEYLHGYTDPVGFLVDLARPIASSQ